MLDNQSSKTVSVEADAIHLPLASSPSHPPSECVEMRLDRRISDVVRVFLGNASMAEKHLFFSFMDLWERYQEEFEEDALSQAMAVELGLFVEDSGVIQ